MGSSMLISSWERKPSISMTGESLENMFTMTKEGATRPFTLHFETCVSKTSKSKRESACKLSKAWNTLPRMLSTCGKCLAWMRLKNGQPLQRLTVSAFVTNFTLLFLWTLGPLYPWLGAQLWGSLLCFLGLGYRSHDQLNPTMHMQVCHNVGVVPCCVVCLLCTACRIWLLAEVSTL